MKNKYLIVVDVQNDFIYGTLGTKEAQAAANKIIKRVKSFDGRIIFTQDTHNTSYLDTQEGRRLPVKHCIKNTDGWQLIDELKKFQQDTGAEIYQKHTFGSVELANKLAKEYETDNIESIEIIGVCTDICVISNALIIKAYMPELPVFVDADCCAGVTPDKHEKALEVMESCQVIVLRREEV
ncbi:MAG: cysteine hydrolase family protein [Monoglobales bacterium]